MKIQCDKMFETLIQFEILAPETFSKQMIKYIAF